MEDVWIIPCNVKVFDVVEHFKDKEEICWKRGAGEKTGDIVYVYVGIPHKAIMYKCVVINDRVSDEEMKEHPYATKGNIGSAYRYMKLRKIYTFVEPITLEETKDFGIYRIRKQARVDKKILQYLLNAEENNR